MKIRLKNRDFTSTEIEVDQAEILDCAVIKYGEQYYIYDGNMGNRICGLPLFTHINPPLVIQEQWQL